MRILIILGALLMAAPAVGRDLAITNVTVLDGTGGRVENATVIVKGDRIARVAAGARPPAGARRIDGRGKFLIPGLMDVHIHLVGTGQWRGLENPPGVAMDFTVAEAALHGYLYFGVTSVYDSGNIPAFIYKLRAQERAGEIVSPRIFATGSALSYPGSWMAGDWHGVGAPDWPETTRVLDQLIAAKPDMQKLVMERFGIGPNPLTPHLRPELAAKIVDYLKARGVRTTVHATVEDLARGALAAGVDSFAHPVGLGRATPAFLKDLATRKVPVATTLSVIEEIVRLSEQPNYLDDPMYRAVFTDEEIAARKATGGPRYSSLGWTSFFKMVLPYMIENVCNLHAAGGILALGTDRSEGPLVHRELELLAANGVPVPDLLRIATYNGAVFLGREKELGSISPGKLADLVLVDADPTVDVTHYRKISAVIKGGQVVDRTALKLPANRR